MAEENLGHHSVEWNNDNNDFEDCLFVIAIRNTLFELTNEIK
jgi:hypothetical protein